MKGPGQLNGMGMGQRRFFGILQDSRKDLPISRAGRDDRGARGRDGK